MEAVGVEEVYEVGGKVIRKFVLHASGLVGVHADPSPGPPAIVVGTLL